MSNGTHIDDVYAPRIHKSNARETRDEADECVRMCRERLLVLASVPRVPVCEGQDSDPTPWHDYILREVPAEIDAIIEESHRSWLAGMIIDYPDYCRDELVPGDWPDKGKDGGGE